MNELVYASLAKKAGSMMPKDKLIPYDYQLYIKLITELVVRECLDVMSKTSKEANERFTYMGDDVPTVVHQMNIEKHFGVKE